jgi:hypothetical protein
MLSKFRKMTLYRELRKIITKNHEILLFWFSNPPFTNLKPSDLFRREKLSSDIRKEEYCVRFFRNKQHIKPFFSGFKQELPFELRSIRYLFISLWIK